MRCRNASRAYHFVLFPTRLLPPPPPRPRARARARARPRQWNSTSGSRRARGAVLLKIHSLPLPPTLPNPPPSRPGPAAEVASGNLHLIPGGPLCHQVAGSRATEKGGRLSLSLSLSLLRLSPFVATRNARSFATGHSVARPVRRTKKESYTQLHATFN